MIPALLLSLIVVGPLDDLQAAFSKASPGDVIEVTGWHHGPFVVPVPVTVRSSDSNFIEGLIVTAPWIELDHVEVLNGLWAPGVLIARRSVLCSWTPGVPGFVAGTAIIYDSLVEGPGPIGRRHAGAMRRGYLIGSDVRDYVSCLR